MGKSPFTLSVVNLRMEEKSFTKKSQNRYSKAVGLIWNRFIGFFFFFQLLMNSPNRIKGLPNNMPILLFTAYNISSHLKFGEIVVEDGGWWEMKENGRLWRGLVWRGRRWRKFFKKIYWIKNINAFSLLNENNLVNNYIFIIDFLKNNIKY
jgi:hypothetical protein